MELKYGIHYTLNTLQSSNCTFMELKFQYQVSSDLRMMCYNCTFMEFKFLNVSDLIVWGERF